MSDGNVICGQGSAVRRGRKVHWRRDPVILGRLPRVDRMRLAGKTQAEIARAIGISEATVRDDLKRVNDLWKERIQGEQADLRAEIVGELDDTRRRALEAAEWDQMCEAAVLFDGRPPNGSASSTTDEDD